MGVAYTNGRHPGGSLRHFEQLARSNGLLVVGGDLGPVGGLLLHTREPALRPNHASAAAHSLHESCTLKGSITPRSCSCTPWGRKSRPYPQTLFSIAQL